MRPITIFVLVAIFTSSPVLADSNLGGESAKGIVTLDLSSCASDNVDLIRGVVQLELGDLLRTTSQPEQQVTHVRAECRTDEVLITVDDPITEKLLHRTLATGALAGTNKSRMVGLAIAELVAASWAELQLERVPTTQAVSSPVTDRASAFVRKRVQPVGAVPKRPWRTGADVRLSSHSTGLKMAGVGATMGRDWTENVELNATVDYLRGNQQGPGGDVHVQSTTAGADIGARLRFGQVDLVGELGMRFGAVTLRGEDKSRGLATASSFSSPWGGAAASAKLRIQATSWLLVQVRAEYGAVLVGVSARVLGRVQSQVEGRWMAVTTGLAIVL
tara:strand:+ start:8227 stop:9222 length:996 start_codon:yes stop_codon:yes gene_type:complete